MGFKISKVDVYVSDMVNKPGMLARILESLSNAGANLEFVIARNVTPNTSRVFMAPLSGRKVLTAAANLGLSKAASTHGVRIEGPDRAGLGAKITRGLAAVGLNLRGLSAASIKKGSVCYIALSTAAEQAEAIKALRIILGGR
jgi:hypothetical protein